MNKITVIAAIFVATFIGALAGYWYRGQVLVGEQTAAIMAPAHVITLAPPSKDPLPLVSGNLPAKK